ncbi:uncharacterized protein Dana_GF26569 [Drosophila ananassae]|uniref:Uncharacterized protein n=1 Tax=Drosophila ananassae TaxID=7217 RepID=A0A0P9AGW6_DROAN|nr:uncharacterized protein Dana_GF26569 [Drosophila ananassae]
MHQRAVSMFASKIKSMCPVLCATPTSPGVSVSLRVYKDACVCHSVCVCVCGAEFITV